jgi:HlyD family secretion protein
MRRPSTELDEDGTQSRSPVRKIVAIVVILAVIVAGATAAMALTKSSPHSYRTATVTTGAVTKTLNSSGILQPIAQATVAFPIAGTVKTVNVHIGSAVTVGQTLATLDTTSLQQQLLSKQASLASAQLTLYKALNGESVTGSGSHSSSGTGSSQSSSNSQNSSSNSTLTAATTSSSQSGRFIETAFTPGSGHGNGGSTNGGSNGKTSGATSVQAAQLLLIAAQKQADAAMNTVQVALQAAEQACGSQQSGPHNGHNNGGGTGGTGGTGGAGGGTGGGGGGTTTTTAPTNNTPTSGLGSQACITAQQHLFTAQQALGDAQQQVTVAANTLTQMLNSSSSTPSSTPSTHSGSGTSGGSTHSSTSSASTPTAQQLVAYQAAVDAAATEVMAAAQALQQATIASPLTGAVAALSITQGSQLSANSTTDTVVVVGTGGYEVATAVSVNDIESVKVGQSATVIADGTNAPLTAKVVSIGVAPTTSGNTTMYPVVLGLTSTTNGLRNGGTATTAIQVAHANNSALVVPTSAIHTQNNLHFVTVLQGHTTSNVRVTVGVIGPEMTQITSGLQAGQVIVLADLKQAVPSSNLANRFGTGTGGLGGALTGSTGFGGGGFGGGGGTARRGG